MINKEKQSFFFHFILLSGFYLKKENVKAKKSRGEICLALLSYFINYYLDLWLRKIIAILNRIRETKTCLNLRKQILLSIPALKKNTYFVSPPVNLTLEHVLLFKNDYYFLRPLKVQVLRDISIYLTRYTGVVYKRYCVDKTIYSWKLDKKA